MHDVNKNEMRTGKGRKKSKRSKPLTLPDLKGKAKSPQCQESTMAVPFYFIDGRKEEKEPLHLKGLDQPRMDVALHTCSLQMLTSLFSINTAQQEGKPPLYP